MMTRGKIMACAAFVVLLGGCNKKETSRSATAGDGVSLAVPVLSAAVVPVASHLGIATQVPADADLFFAGYGADERIQEVARALVSMGVADVTEIEIAGPDADPVESEAAGSDDMVRQFAPYVGDECFLFVGPGMGRQAEMLGTTYRDLSAAWAGFATGLLLDKMADKEKVTDFSELTEELSDDLLDKWMDALEKDERLQIPSVVMGWRPHADKQGECRDAVAKGLEEAMAEAEHMTPVKFERSGVAMSGHELSGREVFGEMVTQAREELRKQEGGAEALEKISPERMERLLVALEKVRFTIATGAVDGRILIYLGNGEEGFHLAESPETSLAATEDLKWTHDFAAKRIAGVAYLSEAMVGAALPWLDTSDYWMSLSRAIRPPVRDEKMLREVLASIADTGGELARREASAWSAVIAEDGGWRYESRGGWADPALNYSAPLRLVDAAISQKPAIRMHWVQNRARNEMSWKQVEHFGVLLESVWNEYQAVDPSTAAMVPEGTVPRMMKEMREMNRAYREELHAGMGDEVAFVMDFQGEVPPLPGVTEEMVGKALMPRFVVARPIMDRAMIDASGASFAASWKSLTEWASEMSGDEVPLILPQQVESGGLVTWYPPLPFIGGDFIPGVTMSDELWMMGTSKSLAAGFAGAMAEPGSASESGMIVEMDFAPIREWLGEVYKESETDLEQWVGDAPDVVKGVGAEDLERAAAGFQRLEGLSYRKWLTDGTPRTSLHLRIAAAK